MKISDFVFDFAANMSSQTGFCRIRIFYNHQINENPIILITELHKNDGQSVTNAVEGIIQALTKQGLIASKNCIFVEHYERLNGNDDTFHEVLLFLKQTGKS